MLDRQPTQNHDQHQREAGGHSCLPVRLRQMCDRPQDAHRGQRHRQQRQPARILAECANQRGEREGPDPDRGRTAVLAPVALALDPDQKTDAERLEQQQGLTCFFHHPITAPFRLGSGHRARRALTIPHCACGHKGSDAGRCRILRLGCFIA